MVDTVHEAVCGHKVWQLGRCIVVGQFAETAVALAGHVVVI